MRPPEARKRGRPGPEARRRRTALKLCAQGCTPREIADALGTSERAVVRLLGGVGVVVV